MNFHDFIGMNVWVFVLVYAVSVPFRLFLYMFYSMGREYYD
jgi:hypothetical protein